MVNREKHLGGVSLPSVVLLMKVGSFMLDCG